PRKPRPLVRPVAEVTRRSATRWACGVAPLRSCQLAADVFPNLPIEVNQRRVDGVVPPIFGGLNRENELGEARIGLCWRSGLARPRCPDFYRSTPKIAWPPLRHQPHPSRSPSRPWSALNYSHESSAPWMGPCTRSNSIF